MTRFVFSGSLFSLNGSMATNPITQRPMASSDDYSKDGPMTDTQKTLDEAAVQRLRSPKNLSRVRGPIEVSKVSGRPIQSDLHAENATTQSLCAAHAKPPGSCLKPLTRWTGNSRAKAAGSSIYRLENASALRGWTSVIGSISYISGPCERPQF